MGMSTSSGPLIADQPLGRRQRAGVIGFVNDGQSHAVLRDALSAYSSETIDLRRGDVRTATEVMARTDSPDILIVDISGVSAPMQALSNLADVVEPGVQVLVIGDAVDVDFYRQVTRGLGVAEYIFKPISREMVGRYFGPLISRQAIPVEADRGGRMVAVIGARGGVGATTIAANLAWQFGVLSNRHTVLVEADLHRGAAAAMLLGTTVGSGLKMALERPDRIDSLFIERSAQAVSGRLHLLASEEKFGVRTEPAPGAAQRLIETLRLRYNFVIVDIPPVALLNHFDLLDLAHHRVVVLDPSLSGLRDALRVVAIPNGPFQPQRPTVVLNRYDPKSGLTPQRIEAEAGITVDITVADLGSQFTQYSNLGKPAIERFKPFRQAVLDLAHEVGLGAAVESGGAAASSGRQKLGNPLVRLLGRSTVSATP